MSDQTFSEFLTFCEEYLKDTDAVELKKLMIRRYNDCNHDFKSSGDFKDLVLITRAKIDSDSTRVFVHLRDFLGELKAYRNKKEKKKGTKRARDSELSDTETPSPKSLKGDNSESSSDEKFLASHNKGLVTNSKSDTDSGVDSKVWKYEEKSKKSPLVNGIHENSNDVTVLEVASQSDDDCVMVIDDDDDDDDKDGDVKDSLKNKSIKIDDNATARSPLSAKKNTNAFQAAFQNFTNRTSDEIDDSKKQEGESELQNGNKDDEELSKMSDENESDSVKKLKVITLKEVNKSNNNESNSDEVDKTVDKITKSKCDNQSETALDKSFGDSPKPSTSADYKIPENLEESINDTCDDSDIPSDNITDHKSSDVDEGDRNGEDGTNTTKNGPSELKNNQNREEGNQSVTDTPEKTVRTKKASQRQIRRLEQLLEDIRDQIEKLKEKELSLDELDDDESAYVLEDKYQRKFVKVWNKLCELKGRAETTGRPTERRFIYTGTRYPEINKKIERFVNKKKVFPDYGDIHNIVAKVNMKQGLGLKGPRVDQLSRETFADVGNRLQKRRKEDLNITFLGHLTKNSNFQQAVDPALKDPDLKKTLEENKKISKTKLEEVINKYADKQVGEDTETENKENDENNDDDEDEEEEEETEDIEVPEINHIIHDISDEEGEDNSNTGPKPEVIITPLKERKKRVEDIDSDSSSENDDSGDEESHTIDKELKVVVTDIMKHTSPYKYGLDVLVKESKDIVIETEENCQQGSQELIEIDEDETEDCENKNYQNSLKDKNTVDFNKKSRNLIAEFDKTENKERSESVSPELKSTIDSLVTHLIDEESRSSVKDEETRSSTKDDDLVVVKSRSCTPELTLKITAVRHIEQTEICEESESNICESESELSKFGNEPISFAENFNDHSELIDCVGREKCTENFETISVDSSENDSEDISSYTEMGSNDKDEKILSYGAIASGPSNSSKVTSHTSSNIPSSSSSSSASSSEACQSNVDTRTLNTEANHTQGFKKSSIEPSRLLNRIVTLAKNKFKLKKSRGESSGNCLTRQPIENCDVIEIDDSDDDDEEESHVDEINENIYDENNRVEDENDGEDDGNGDDDNYGNCDDDDNDIDDCCIILSDSD